MQCCPDEEGWQDAYLLYLQEAESGLSRDWAVQAGSSELLGELGYRLVSGCPADLIDARNLVIQRMQNWAKQQADQSEVLHQ